MELDFIHFAEKFSIFCIVCALPLIDILGRWESLQSGGLNFPFRGFLAFQKGLRNLVR